MSSKDKLTPDSPIFRLIQTVTVRAMRLRESNIEPTRLALGGMERAILEEAGKRGYMCHGPDKVGRRISEHTFMGWTVVPADCLSIVAFEWEIK